MSESELTRLLEGDAEGSDLLRTALDEDIPSPGARKKTLRALEIGTGVATSALLWTWFVRFRAWKVSMWKVILVGLLSGGALVTTRPNPPPNPPEAPKRVEPPIAAIPPAPTPTPQPVKVEDPAPAPLAEASIAVPHGDAPKPRAARPASLTAEIASLDLARSALADGDAKRALRNLDAHDHDFPNGALAQEAVMLRIEALVATGDMNGARAVGHRFLVGHPDSAHADRIRTLLGETP
jgi:hypothetical protein